MPVADDRFPGGSRRREAGAGRSPRSVLLSLALLLTALSAAPAWGRARIRDVTVDIAEGEIVASARLTGGFNRTIVRDIQNGIPKDFYYYVLLKRRDPNWFDEEILAKTVRYSVKYDTLKKQYRIVKTIDDQVVKQQVPDFEKMREIVSQVNRVRLAPVTLLKRRRHYYVSVKSQMQAPKRPFYLDYFLFFIPFLEIDTPWADSPQITLPPRRG